MNELEPVDAESEPIDPQTIATLAPHYPIEDVLRLIRGARPGPAPVAPRAGFLDRLGAGLADIQSPGAGGRAGDVFGANLIASAARGFGGNRVAARDAQLKAQMDAYTQTNDAKKQELAAQLTGVTKDYETQRGAAENATTAAAALAKERRQAEIDRRKESQRKGESDRDYNLRVRGEARQERKDAADAKSGPAGSAANKPAMQQATAFYNRSANAVNTVSVPDKAGKSLEQRIAGLGTLSQIGLTGPNVLQTPDMRIYNQAIREFATAILRKESGAAISPSEYEGISKTYFVQPGDDDATIKIKQHARAVAVNGMKLSASPDVGGGQTPAIPATWTKVK
jgi:hypothetical protein